MVMFDGHGRVMLCEVAVAGFRLPAISFSSLTSLQHRDLNRQTIDYLDGLDATAGITLKGSR